MRKEIKNLRQMLDSAVRAHRKHLVSVQAAVSKINLSNDEKERKHLPSPQAALEQGHIQTVPIGYISSCFSMKNGTPRQPTVCGPSRGELRIKQSVFNNPEHALVGLEQFSHVWIIFLFHKNGHLSCKAKVKPPRLNGQRVGVYSTRSPHRPNALGLTLAKLDKIEGDTLHLSGIDMIAGTPVLDIKPYIPEYDSPDTRINLDLEQFELNTDQPTATPLLVNREVTMSNLDKGSETENADVEILFSKDKSETDISFTHSSSASEQLFLPKDLHSVLEEVEAFMIQDDISQHGCEGKSRLSESAKRKQTSLAMDHPCYGEEACATIAGWIREPPVASLDVRFTPHAERQLAEFVPTHLTGLLESDRPRFKFLHSSEEAAAAIKGVLSADPRSVYRRTRCRDRLFFFTLDTADITCWFGHGFAEILQVRPVERHIVSV